MPSQSWTPEQVLLLAPDDASRKNAVGFASLGKWLHLGIDDPSQPKALWGECRGSSADPYRCQVDLTQVGFQCSCPSRKRPCKHSLGLLLLYAGQPDAFETLDPPDYVRAWLAKRAEHGERTASRQVAQPSGASEASRARRAAAREEKVRAGLDDLETWLRDLARQGLAAAQSQPAAFWENAAARLVDAQAPGLARLVRQMGSAAHSGSGWQDRLADLLARLYLALQGYRRIETLPEAHQADLRAVIGFTLRQDDLLENAPAASRLTDSWLVLGSAAEEEAGLRTLRTWLAGRDSGRMALVLSYSLPGQPAAKAAETNLTPGRVIETEMVFYPGAYPLRGVPRPGGANRPLEQADLDRLTSCRSLTAAAGMYAEALAANPWIEQFPLLIAEAGISYDGGWLLYDENERWIRVDPAFRAGEAMLGVSGGRPLNIFGEWNGSFFQPVSFWNSEIFHLVRPEARKA